MTIVDIIGALAAVFTTVSFLPQIVRVYRTKHARDLSMPMYVIFSAGVFLWMCYGLLINSSSIIAANGLTLIMCFYILAMKAKYR
jgi:MtN3 and saliva related transmembrane protein